MSEPMGDLTLAHHIYVSTYCQHGLHDRCRLTCKICAGPCRCPCHDTQAVAM